MLIFNVLEKQPNGLAITGRPGGYPDVSLFLQNNCVFFHICTITRHVSLAQN